MASRSIQTATGLADYVEDANGNGAVNSGETDWQDPDTDYDGRSDRQELTDGTSPTNSQDVIHVPLGYWKFDNTNTWVGEQGQLPLQATNVIGVRSWSSNIVVVNHTNPATLRYRDVGSQ